MKAKMFALGALCVAALIGILSFVMPRRSKKAEEFKDSLEESRISLHKKAANESFKKAKDHLKAAKEAELKKDPKPPGSIDEAINNWNDDSL